MRGLAQTLIVGTCLCVFFCTKKEKKKGRVALLYETNSSSSIFVVSPQVCAVSPQVCAVSPQVCVVSPQVCAVSPQVCAVSPQVCAVSPQVCFLGRANVTCISKR